MKQMLVVDDKATSRELGLLAAEIARYAARYGIVT
jgi:hypothetical protein